MRGDGIRPAITTADMSAARLLDLTRSLRRMGRMPTGIDRVERAYLTHLLADDVPVFGLVRTALGYVLLDQDGLHAFAERMAGRIPWPAPDALSRWTRRSDDLVAAVETSVRRDAVARCVPWRLKAIFARHLPRGFEYFNTGHSNLTDRVLQAVASVEGRITVLIHDMIPLEHPEFQRPGTVDVFRDKMRRVARFADRIICNSEDTRQRTEAVMRDWGEAPPCVVAPLGVSPPVPDATQLPRGLPPERPYFVTVGTIEPRKNHGFLLDLWDEMGPDAPPLLICGSRGWNNADVFRRLDALPAHGPVKEIAGLSDPALAALVSESAGALFPSHAEGYGLPPIEALALETRVLCNDLPVFREILGDKADFLPVTDSQSWLDAVRGKEKQPSTVGKAHGFVAPTWVNHFNTVLRLK